MPRRRFGAPSCAPAPTRALPRFARARRTAASLVLALVATSVLAVAGPNAPATAAPRDFTVAYSVNTNGSILVAANTLMSCRATASGCATARAATTGNYSNNNYPSAFVDIDGDATTFNSSSTTLQIPAGGTVLYAALVWAGRTGSTAATNADPARRQLARFTVPDGAGHRAIDVTATQVDVISDSNGVAYQSILDVTSTVQTAGSGTYTLANVQSSSGSTNQYAGWSLVVVVADPSAPARNLTVFTGFASVSSSDPSLTMAVSGFLTPPSGPVQTTMGAISYEGDMGLTGDTFTLASVGVTPVRTTTITDALNPATNVFNSSISDRGVAAPGRTPSYANQLGFDADLYQVNGALPNSATGAEIRLTTSGEQYFPGVVTFATDLYDPKLLGTKTVTDLDGGAVEAGDVLRYTVPVENIGLDTASRSRFFDAIPTGTTYVPGSITIDGVPQTDALDGDTTQFVADDNGHVLAYLGTGATPTAGGAIPMTSGTAQHVVTFDVTVDANVTNGQELTNAAALTYRGLTTEAAASSATNAVISPVVADPAPGGNLPPDATPHVVTFTPTPGARDVDIAVLAGDTDPEGGPLTVVAVTDAANGTVTINPDGTVTYAPRDDAAGRDVFTYTIEDAAGNRSTATIQVEVVNTAPVASDDAATITAGSPAPVAVLANDVDPNGDALAVRTVDATSTQGGTLALEGGVVTYTPPAGFVGTDTFAYTVEDSRGGTDTATVTVTVTNAVPVAGDDAYTTDAGVAVDVAVRGNDVDPNGDALTVALVTAPAHGSLVLNADGTGRYTPAGGFAGTDSFTYRVSDGRGGTDTATVTIVVNGAPVAADDAAPTAPGAAVTVPVLGNDTDPDGDPLTVTSATDPAHGSAVVNADGTLTYTPDAGWAGPDTVTYTVTDGRLTDTATLTVTTANAAPVAGADTASTPTNTALTGFDVLANDSDPNVTAGVPGQVLVVVDASADHGAEVDVEADGTLTVTPATGYAGTVTVTYTLSDSAGGSVTGTLTLTVDNAAPSAVADGPVSTPTNGSVLIDVLANDTDANTGDTLTIDGDSLTAPVDADGHPAGTVEIEDGRIRYTPPPGFTGGVSFEYDVTDGASASTTTVVVVVENAAPVAADDTATTPSGTAVTVDVLANDTDANDHDLTVIGATADNGATAVVEADGTVTVTPTPGFKGDISVTYTLGDGAGGTDVGTLTVTVLNAPPVTVDDDATTPYATAVDVDLLANDTDANPGDTLAVVDGSVTAPVDAVGTPRGTVTVTDGIATLTPPAGFSGEVTFDYEVTDGTATAGATVTITVGNAAPVAADDAATTTPGTPVTIDVVGNDTDADGGTLVVVDVSQPENGTVTIVDGSLVYTPNPGFTGTETFTYELSDGQGGTITGTVTVEVTAPAAPGGGGGPLPDTGLEVAALAGLAALLVAAGVALALVARRRRTGGSMRA